MAWEGEGGDETVQEINNNQRRLEQLYCQAGNTLYCSYAELHPVETIASIAGGLLLSGVIGGVFIAPATISTDTIIISGGIAESANIACGLDLCSDEIRNSVAVGKAGVDQVMDIIKDPSAIREVSVYINQAGKRANLFARFDILTSQAIHEVKNVANLSLTKPFMEQAVKYKAIADSAGLELHYWLTNDAPQRVQDWLRKLEIFVHTP